MRADVAIDGVRAQAFEIPTDKGEADGTIDWNSTTLVLVEVSGGGKRISRPGDEGARCVRIIRRSRCVRYIGRVGTSETRQRRRSS
jgi:hypothetical protein